MSDEELAQIPFEDPEISPVAKLIGVIVVCSIAAAICLVVAARFNDITLSAVYGPTRDHSPYLARLWTIAFGVFCGGALLALVKLLRRRMIPRDYAVR